jgi:zinc protease
MNQITIPRITCWIAVAAFVVIATAFPTVFAQTDAPDNGSNPMPDSTPASPYVRMVHMPHNVTLGELANGLTVIVQEHRVAPVATVRCYIRNTGSAFEGKYLGAGLSHVLEHVVAGGTTTNRTEKEIEAIVDSFGGATNAFTSKDMTAYFIDCPAKDVLQATELIADSMQNIVFESTEFDRELKVVQQELKDGEAQRSRVLWSMLSKTVYTHHPTRHPIIGYQDVLEKMAREEIIDFYKERYVPNNQVFVVVGDVDTDEVMARVAAEFEGTPRGPETIVPMPIEPNQLTPRTASREMDGETYDFVLSWPTVELSHEDLYPLDLAAYILSRGPSSRLVRRLKYEEQLVLSISSASYTPEYVRGYFAVFAATTAEQQELAMAEIQNEVYRLKTELVDETTLAKAKRQKATELIFGRQTVQEAAESLGRSFISTGDPLFDESYVEAIQNVTAEQIIDVAQRYFVPERLSTIIIAPPGGIADATESADGVEDDDIQSVVLPNGVRVLVKQHANLPILNVQMFSIGASLVDTPETAGRTSLVAAMLNKGTPTRSAREIAEYFDSIGGSFGFQSGRNTLLGGFSVLEEDFTDATNVLAECVLHPTFPEDEFANMKMLMLGSIARRAADPQSEVMELFNQNLPEGSPYQVIQGGTQESVEPLTIDDLRAYHAQFLVPENLMITVFGDVDPDEALATISREFESLEPSGDWEPVEFDHPNSIEEATRIHKQTGKPTGMVMIGYPAVSVFDEHDYASLTVLDAVMSGYGYPGGWLHTELRGEGLVYGVHAFLLSGPAPGYFAVLAQTSPEHIGEVLTRIEANVERAKSGDIPEEEFERAKEQIIALHSQSNTTISEQAQQAALDTMYGFGLDHDANFDARIEAVTLEDVVRVAQTYLNNGLTVTCSPDAE